MRKTRVDAIARIDATLATRRYHPPASEALNQRETLP
jgi:hypothetical protein